MERKSSKIVFFALEQKKAELFAIYPEKALCPIGLLYVLKGKMILC